MTDIPIDEDCSSANELTTLFTLSNSVSQASGNEESPSIKKMLYIWN